MFAWHFLPEYFFAEPASVFDNDGLEASLQAAWQAGVEECREFALQGHPPTAEALDWPKARAVLVRLVAPKTRGESLAALLCWRPGTGAARVYFLEQAESGYVLTSLDSDRRHTYHRDLEQPSLQQFTQAARELAEGQS